MKELTSVRTRGQLRLGVRISVASLLAFATCHLLGISPSYPAVLTAVVVTQASVGASLKAMLDRFAGSFGGAVWGVAVLLALHPSDPFKFGMALALGLVPLAFLAAFKPAYRAAPMTAIILLLSPSSAGGPLIPAFQRVSGIGLGSVVALVVALLVLPARAHESLVESASRAIIRMGDLAAILLDGLFGPGDAAAIQALQTEIRLALVQAEAASDEVTRERASFLASGPDAQPICRTLRRLRSDLAMIGRATAGPLPEPLKARLEESISAAALAIAAYFRASGEAIANRKHSPSLNGVIDALERHSSEVTKLRQSGITREMSDEMVGQLFGFEFGLEQLHQNLEDLAARIDELA